MDLRTLAWYYIEAVVNLCVQLWSPCYLGWIYFETSQFHLYSWSSFSCWGVAGGLANFTDPEDLTVVIV